MNQFKVAKLSAVVASLVLTSQSMGAVIVQYGFDHTSGTVQSQGTVINDANPGTFNMGSLRRGDGGTYSSDIPTGTQFTTGIGSLDTSTGAFRTGTGASSGEGVANFETITNAGGITLEAWVKGGNNGLILTLGGAYNLRGTTTGYSTYNGFRELTDFITVDVDRSEWNHIAVVFSNPVLGESSFAMDMSFYLNGTLVGSRNTLFNVPGHDLTRGIGVGDHPINSVPVPFNGLIYEPRISLGALTPSEFTIVPEPASLALIGMGATLLMARRRRA